MANESKTQLKSYFQLGDKPNQAQFENLIDSMVDADQAGYSIFSTSESYVIGEVVAYGGKFYKFINVHAAGAWNADDVEPTSIKAETDVKLNELESEVKKLGVSLSLDSSATNTFISADYTIIKGVTYKIEVKGVTTVCNIYVNGSWVKVTGNISNSYYIFTASENATRIQFYAVSGTVVNVYSYSELHQQIDNNSKGLAVFRNHIYNVTERNNTTYYSDIATAASAIPKAERYMGMIVIYASSAVKWNAFLYSTTLTDDSNFTSAGNWIRMSRTDLDIIEQLLKGKSIYNVSADMATYNYANLASALQSVALRFRRGGMLLIWANSTTSWNMAQYTLSDTTDSNFYNVQNWDSLLTRNTEAAINVSGKKTLDEAINEVPINNKVSARVITYRGLDGASHTAQFNSDTLLDESIVKDPSSWLLDGRSTSSAKAVIDTASLKNNIFKGFSMLNPNGQSADVATYIGKSGYVYSLPIKNIFDSAKQAIDRYYCRFDFRIDGNIYDSTLNKESGVGGFELCPLFEIVNSDSPKLKVGFYPSELSAMEDNNQILPAISSKTAFVACNLNHYGQSLAYDDWTMPLIKLRDAFAIRWVGELSNDIYMRKSNGTIEIYSETSTLHSFNLSNYATMTELISAINEVAELDAKPMNEGKPTDIHDFDNIPLLKSYTMTDYTDAVIGDTRYNPFVVVKSDIADTWHKIEIAGDRDVAGYLVVMIDGVTVREFSWSSFIELSNNSVLYFGGTPNGSTLPISIRNIDVRINDLEDVAVHKVQVGSSTSMNGGFISSNENKHILCIVGHGMDNSSENLVEIPKYEKMFATLKDAGYLPINSLQLRDYVNGIANAIPNKAYCMVYDDSQYQILLNDRNHALLCRYGIPACNAVIPEDGPIYTYEGEDYQYKELNGYLNAIGWHPIAHTNTCLKGITADELIAFAKRLKLDGIRYQYDAHIFVVAYAKYTLVAANALKLFGVDMIQNGRGVVGYVTPSMNKYRVNRIGLDSEGVEGYLLKS